MGVLPACIYEWGIVSILNLDLKPLSIGQLLDKGIRLYRNHFLLFMGIVALAQIPSTLVYVIAGIISPAEVSPLSPGSSSFELLSDSLTQSTMIESFLLTMVVLILTVLLSILGAAAMVRAAAVTYLGEEISIVGAYRAILKDVPTLCVAFLFLGFLMIGIGIWWVFVPVLGWATGLGMLVFFSLVVIPFVTPGVVVEDQPATQVIQRAWDLARRRFWWLMGFMLILGLLGQFLVTAPAGLAYLLLNSALAGSVNQITIHVLQQLISLLVNLIYLPLQLTCVTLLYFDVRVRTEGLDLTLQTMPEKDTLTTDDLNTVLTNTPSGKMGFLPSWEEMAYFFGITAGFFLLCIVFYVVIFALFGILMMSSGGM